MAGTRESSQQRREGILRVAMHHFLDSGYDQTSTEVIARDASTSKATLYKWFGNKQAFFETVIEYASEYHSFTIDPVLEKAFTAGLHEFLEEVTYRILENMYAPDLLRLHQLVISESSRFPRIADIFVKQGASVFHASLTGILAEWHSADGTERIAHPEQLTDMLIAEGQGSKHYLLALLGQSALKSEADKRRFAHQIVASLTTPLRLAPRNPS